MTASSITFRASKILVNRPVTQHTLPCSIISAIFFTRFSLIVSYISLSPNLLIILFHTIVNASLSVASNPLWGIMLRSILSSANYASFFISCFAYLSIADRASLITCCFEIFIGVSLDNLSYDFLSVVITV